jgi:hypothetical protein
VQGVAAAQVLEKPAILCGACRPAPALQAGGARRDVRDVLV